MPNIIDNFTSGAAGGFNDFASQAGNVAGQSPLLIVLYLLGQMMDKQQNRDVINPLDALTGSESKGITGAQGRTNYMQTLLQNASKGETQNPAIDSMRQQLQARSTQQFSPLPVDPPARFNPYSEVGPNVPMPTGVDPSLMANTSRLAGGGQSPTGLWGTNVLLNQLANRFGQRNMQGQLNPLALPPGNTKLYG